MHISDNPTLYKLRGAARFSTGDATGARADLQRVLSLDPQDEEARARLQELETFNARGDSSGDDARPSPADER
jgi:hypothetical protein